MISAPVPSVFSVIPKGDLVGYAKSRGGALTVQIFGSFFRGRKRLIVVIGVSGAKNKLVITRRKRSQCVLGYLDNNVVARHFGGFRVRTK
jgi:hypothetical protein